MEQRRRRLGIVDLDTGEIVEEKTVFIGTKTDKDYVKVFVSFLLDVIEDRELSGKASRLLLYMIRHLEYDTLTIKIIPTLAIEELNVTRKTFYEWLGILLKKGILKKKNTYEYELQDYMAVKGSMQKVKQKRITLKKKKMEDTNV